MFGFKAAPLVMGRLSAAVEWLVQSLFHPASGQVQVYIDDVEPGTAQPAVSKGAVRLGSVWSLSCPSQRRAGQIRVGTTFELHRHELVMGTSKR